MPREPVYAFGRAAQGVFPNACGNIRILYPRAAALDGCTAHNAMIWVYPHDADWDAIAAATGDDSWSAASMRRQFQTIENCRHRPEHRWLRHLGLNVTRHGCDAWNDGVEPLGRSSVVRHRVGRATGSIDVDVTHETRSLARPDHASINPSVHLS